MPQHGCTGARVLISVLYLVRGRPCPGLPCSVVPAQSSLDEPASPARLERRPKARKLCGTGNVTADEVVLLFLTACPGTEATGFDLPWRLALTWRRLAALAAAPVPSALSARRRVILAK